MDARWTWMAIAAVAVMGCKSDPKPGAGAGAEARQLPRGKAEGNGGGEAGVQSCAALASRLCELAPDGCEVARKRLAEPDPRCAEWLADEDLVAGLARGLAPGQGGALEGACADLLKSACAHAPALCPELTKRAAEGRLGAWDAARCEALAANPAAMERLMLTLEAVDGRAEATRTTPEAPP